VNTLLFVKGLIGVIVIVAAIGALLSQLQSRKLIPPVFRLVGPALLKWHRWLGRIALGGTVLNSVICMEIGLYPALRADSRHLIHIILGFALAIALLSKTWVMRRKLKWALKRAVPWGIAVFILQAGVFATATAFAIWARIVGLV
jgi:hypothetical protein